MMSEAPLLARFVAMAAPIPRDAPVTMASLPLRGRAGSMLAVDAIACSLEGCDLVRGRAEVLIEEDKTSFCWHSELTKHQFSISVLKRGCPAIGKPFGGADVRVRKLVLGGARFKIADQDFIQSDTKHEVIQYQDYYITKEAPDCVILNCNPPQRTCLYMSLLYSKAIFPP